MSVRINSNGPSTAYVSIADTWGSALGHYGYVDIHGVDDGTHRVAVTDGGNEARGSVAVSRGNGEATVDF